MNDSKADKIKGTVHEAKGKIKEKVGQIISDPDLAAEGQDENVAGKVQKKVGEVKRVFEK